VNLDGGFIDGGDPIDEADEPGVDGVVLRVEYALEAENYIVAGDGRTIVEYGAVAQGYGVGDFIDGLRQLGAKGGVYLAGGGSSSVSPSKTCQLAATVTAPVVIIGSNPPERPNEKPASMIAS